MRFNSSLRARLIGLVAFASVSAVAAFGFTASNTVSTSTAGSGSGTISGYTVSGVKYTLDTTDPSKFASVKFDVEGSDVSLTTAYSIDAKLDTAWSNSCGTRTYAAGPPAKTTVTCTFSGTLPAVSTASSLTVVVAQK